MYTIEAAHNPEGTGSNPAPATEKAPETGAFRVCWASAIHADGALPFDEAGVASGFSLGRGGRGDDDRWHTVRTAVLSD